MEDDVAQPNPSPEETLHIQITVVDEPTPPPSGPASAPVIPSLATRNSSGNLKVFPIEREPHMSHRKARSEGNFNIPPDVVIVPGSGSSDAIYTQSSRSNSHPNDISVAGAGRAATLKAMGSPPRPQDKSPFSFFTKLFSTSNSSAQMKSSATRLSTLPPKPRDEEEKHLKEYEEMMLSYKLKKEEEERKKASVKQKREQRIIDNQKLWLLDILPNWEKRRMEKKTHDMWWQGVPPNVRPKLWPLAIGNTLHVTKDLFAIMIKQAQTRLLFQQQQLLLQQQLAQMSVQSPSNGNSEATAALPPIRTSPTKQDDFGKGKTAELIPLDLPRTFPALQFFQPGGPSHQYLKNVLDAYVCYRPDIGYVQGMSYMAAVLLLYLDEFQAFSAMCNLLNRPMQLVFYRFDMPAIRQYLQVFDWLLEENMPEVFAHFDHINVTSEMFMLDWVLTIFAKSLPIDIASRIWDIYSIEGEHVLFKAALGILRVLRDRILNTELDGFMKLLSSLGDTLCLNDEDAIFENISHIRCEKDHYEELLKNAQKAIPSES